MESLSLPQIKAAMANFNAGPFGIIVHYYPQVKSTNDVARELAEKDAPEGTLVVTDMQTRGRGRLARQWIAPPGSSLLMSIILRPNLPPTHAHRLVIACGLALAEACEAVTGVRVAGKWPNDLQVGGKKVAGILAESAIEGEQLAWVIIGAGLNVNQVFEPDDPLAKTATSLRMETGRSHDRASVLAQTMTRLRDWYPLVDQKMLITAWRTRCPMLGQSVQAETSDGVLVGVAEDIDETGALLLRDTEGQRHCLTHGDTTILAQCVPEQ
ncbi:MAG: biotin--[acetyl-CoA-carboxylase] ligase [Anaerolineae bacterium]|nr:biotin--[acetyl-CoA-carboxylase] ligase [Anaerolineae bacterium]